jgi:hypothetical protein
MELGWRPVRRARPWAAGRPRQQLYWLRWSLDDLSIFTFRLRAAHGRTGDAEHALGALEITLAGAPA